MAKHNHVELSRDGADLFVIVNGVRIAKRGHPGTPQAGTWIPLEPGWEVHDSDDLSEIVVIQDGARVH